jgi:molybdopterin-guanine dinucleotide biosynthesis protein A
MRNKIALAAIFSLCASPVFARDDAPAQEEYNYAPACTAPVPPAPLDASSRDAVDAFMRASDHFQDCLGRALGARQDHRAGRGEEADRRQGHGQPAAQGKGRQGLQRGRFGQDALRIWGIVLAGGASTRMGAAKPLMPFRAAKLIDAVIARAARQVERLAIDVPPTALRDYPYEIVLPDLYAETLGPLCGVVTGLAWLEADVLATFPCDAPFLPRDLVTQLAKHKLPAVAKDAPVCGLWPKSALAPLKEGLENGSLRSVRGAVEALGGTLCDIDAPEHAFFNVNTREDLAFAETL